MVSKLLLWLQERIKLWTKPATSILIIGILSDLTRNRTDLVVENGLLRQQLIVLNRQIKLPPLTNSDRFRLVFLSRFTVFWKQSLHIVQPDTLLRWHQELFHFYWKRRSQGQPKISVWGAERIRGELLKLVIALSKRTIQKYMPKARPAHAASQTWATFLKNQAGVMWACDFTLVYDWLFRAWHIFVVLELKTRRIVHSSVTQFPMSATKWNVQKSSV